MLSDKEGTKTEHWTGPKLINMMDGEYCKHGSEKEDHGSNKSH